MSYPSTTALLVTSVCALGSIEKVQASFFENCLFQGAVISVSNKAPETPFTDIVFSFVPEASFSLFGTHRSCTHWHGKEILVDADNPDEYPVEVGAKIAVHYRHYSGRCSENDSCTQTTFIITKLETAQDDA